MVQEGNGEKKVENFQSLDKQADGLLTHLAAPSPVALVDDDLPNDVDSVPNELNCVDEDGLDHRPVANSLMRGPLNYSLSAEDQNRTAESASGTVPNSVKITPSMFEGNNEVIKIKVMKEVRKPGRSKCPKATAHMCGMGEHVWLVYLIYLPP